MASKNFFRTPFNLGDYNDDEINLLPSETDPSQDEPIEKLVARMVRGEQIGGGRPITFDLENGKWKPDQGISVPIQERDGFDIADAAPIIEAGQAAQAELDAAKPAPTPAAPAAPSVAPAPSPAPEPAPPAGA